MTFKLVCLLLIAYMTIIGSAYPYYYGEDRNGNRGQEGSVGPQGYGPGNQGTFPGQQSNFPGQQGFGPAFSPGNQGGSGGYGGQGFGGQNADRSNNGGQRGFGEHRGGYKEYGY
ncbi:rRNA 2'-O-methyltransferase fibrillarin-like [Battus philenor]|uniref:rRNA 2'-O-methyltransferase fibrillarin-like n=1 Tax=Battus philenor TaxID=42288 RepID=UPI0035CFD1A0